MNACSEFSLRTVELNRKKSRVTSCTDITGYGLLGHAEEMATGSGVVIDIFSQEVPYFDLVPELVGQGISTRAGSANQEFLQDKVSFAKNI